MAEFVLIAALLVITPGADMALVTKHALSGGVLAAWRATGGIVSGLALWGGAAAVGVAALFAASAPLFAALKLVGAAYLIYLGLSTFLSEGEAAAQGGGGSRPFRQGLTTNLLNPKIAVFYTTFLPQFVAAGESVLLKSLLLATIHAVLSLVWLLLYGSVVARAGAVLRRPSVRRVVDRLTGAVLVAFGARLALEKR